MPLCVFISSLSLWSVSKKKPLCTVPKAHSKPEGSPEENIPDESWITSLATLRSTDLLASGKKKNNDHNNRNPSLHQVLKSASQSSLLVSQSVSQISQSVSQVL